MELTKKCIHTVKNKTFPSNTYILQSEKNNTCLIIDAGLDAALIDEKITELGLMPLAIIATHGHFDHMGSVSFFKEKYNIPYYLHEADLKISQSANFYLKLAKINLQIVTPFPDVFFKEKKESLTLGDFELSVYHFPGHSNGSCVIACDNCLFSGDIMYKNGTGFNNFPGENPVKLKESIKGIFDLFPAETLVFPGHGDVECLVNIRTDNQALIKFLT